MDGRYSAIIPDSSALRGQEPGLQISSLVSCEKRLIEAAEKGLI
jgi:hypothetical protein